MWICNLYSRVAVKQLRYYPQSSFFLIYGDEIKDALVIKDNYKYTSGFCCPTGDAFAIGVCGYLDKNSCIYYWQNFYYDITFQL